MQIPPPVPTLKTSTCTQTLKHSHACLCALLQVPFLLGVVVRALLLAIHATVCLKSAAPDLTAPVGLLHSVCAAMWLAHSLKQRNTFVSIFASPKADKAQ
eukprot:1162077-Pelagomonas_calceolata.AAC.5